MASETLRNVLLAKASSLTPIALEVPVRTYPECVHIFPILESVTKENWVYFFSTAHIVAATMGLFTVQNIDEGFREDLSRIYGNDLAKKNNNWLEIFNDCNEFVFANLKLFESNEYLTSPRLRTSDTLGLWLTFKLLNKKPSTTEEIELIRPLGKIAVNTFMDWWEEIAEFN